MECGKHAAGTAAAIAAMNAYAAVRYGRRAEPSMSGRRHHRLFDQDLGHQEFSRRALLDPVARARELEREWRDALPDRLPF